MEELISMMGKSHALSGVLAACAVGAYLNPYLDLSPVVLATVATVLPGSSLVPDIDHQKSTVSNTYGPLSRGFSKVLGHRQITHSVPGVLALGVLVHGAVLARDDETVLNQLWSWAGTGTKVLAYGFLCGLLVLVLAAFIRLFRGVPGRVGSWFRSSRIDDLIPIPFVGYVVIISDVDLQVLPIVIMAGCLIHMFGDMITKMGLMIWWPISKKKVRLASITAGGKIERFLIVPVMILGVVWCSGVMIMPWIMEIGRSLAGWW